MTGPRDRELKDMPHEYLCEKVLLLEGYLASMLMMILQHHPYMGPAANDISKQAQEKHEEIEKRYPVSAIVTPFNGVIRPS